MFDVKQIQLANELKSLPKVILIQGLDFVAMQCCEAKVTSKGIKIWQLAIEMCEQDDSIDQVFIPSLENNLASAYAQSGQREQAIASLDKAKKCLTNLGVQSDHPLRKAVEDNLFNLRGIYVVEEK